MTQPQCGQIDCLTGVSRSDLAAPRYSLRLARGPFSGWRIVLFSAAVALTTPSLSGAETTTPEETEPASIAVALDDASESLPAPAVSPELTI